jgi:hypothetical protein
LSAYSKLCCLPAHAFTVGVSLFWCAELAATTCKDWPDATHHLSNGRPLIFKEGLRAFWAYCCRLGFPAFRSVDLRFVAAAATWQGQQRNIEWIQMLLL